MSIPIDTIPGGSGTIPSFLLELGIDLALHWNSPKDFFRTILDPWDLWFDSVFTGRPKVGKDSATEAIVQFIAQNANPVAKWYAHGIRAFEAQGQPISVSHGIWRQRYDRLARSFSDDLTRQFGQSEGSDQFKKWFVALRNIDSGLSKGIRAKLSELYKEAIARGEIDPNTGFPPMACTRTQIATCLATNPAAAQCAPFCDVGSNTYDASRCQKCVETVCNCGGKQPMACTNSHSVTTKASGPGVCCSALAKSGQAPTPGLRVQATDRKGHCIVCEIKVGKKGNLVFKRGKSAGICPTSREGCCALLTQQGAAGAFAFA